MWYSNPEKTFISPHILHQHWRTSPVALPVRRNPQHRSLLTVVSAFSTSVSTSSTSAKRLPTRGKRFKRQTLSIVNRKHFFMNILCTQSFCSQKTHNRTLLFGSIHLKLGRYFEYRNQLLNLRLRVCYLECHEAGLCCYLVIHIENLQYYVHYSCCTSICDLFTDSPFHKLL
jgi:hypothetical protein